MFENTSGIVEVGGLAHARHVHLRGDFHTCATGADDTADDVFDVAAQAAFIGDAAFFRRRGDHGLPVVAHAGREQSAALIDDGDMAGRQSFHGGGNEILDRLHLLAGKGTGGEFQNDGGGRVALVAGKEFAFRQHEVNACAGNTVDRGDGARQLAFE